MKIADNNKKIGEKKYSTIVDEVVDEWKAIQETLYLCSIPGMKESIVSGMKENLKDCSTKVKL